MKEIVILIGIQGSGKSTFCKKIFKDHVRVNLDTLHSRNNENILLEKAFNNGINIVIDNTNPRKSDRKKYIDKAKLNDYKILGYFMQSKIGECIERNNQRIGKEKIPVKAIAHTFNILEMPSLDEGFDELYFVCIKNENYEISEWRCEL